MCMFRHREVWADFVASVGLEGDSRRWAALRDSLRANNVRIECGGRTDAMGILVFVYLYDIYIYIHLHANLNTHTHICVDTYLHAYLIRACVQTSVCVHIGIYTRAHIC